jgi:hypothetical protein
MSLSMVVESNDPDLEKLLGYVLSLRHLSQSEQLDLLISAEAWVRQCDPLFYKITPDPGKTSVQLAIDGTVLHDSRRSHTPVQSLRDELPRPL